MLRPYLFCIILYVPTLNIIDVLGVHTLDVYITGFFVSSWVVKFEIKRIRLFLWIQHYQNPSEEYRILIILPRVIILKVTADRIIWYLPVNNLVTSLYDDKWKLKAVFILRLF